MFSVNSCGIDTAVRIFPRSSASYLNRPCGTGLPEYEAAANLLSSDLVDFFFQRQLVNGRNWQREKQTDPSIKYRERFPKSALHFLGRSLEGGRIRNAPVRRHRLPRPDRANFVCRVVADGKNKIELGCARLREFIPTLAAQIVPRHSARLQPRNSFRPDRS